MLGLIALNGRANAARNPAAIYREPMTMDDYMLGPAHHLPVRALRLRRAVRRLDRRGGVRRLGGGDLPGPAIRIEAVGTQILERVSWDQGTITHEPQVLGQSAHLWSRSGPPARDVDVALLYDGLHLQRHLLARSARLLRLRGSPGLAGQRSADRAGR